jgi:hypothetical protein
LGIIKTKNGACQRAQIAPSTSAAERALPRVCIDSKAYPIQPTSSPAASRKKRGKTAGKAKNGAKAGGIGKPASINPPRDTKKMRGARRIMAAYHQEDERSQEENGRVPLALCNPLGVENPS